MKPYEEILEQRKKDEQIHLSNEEKRLSSRKMKMEYWTAPAALVISFLALVVSIIAICR